MTEAIQAKRSQMRNDLYWSIYSDHGDGSIRWIGYNDTFWWTKVSPTEHARTRIGKTGRTYTIDFQTGLVVVGELPA